MNFMKRHILFYSDIIMMVSCLERYAKYQAYAY